MLSLCLLTLQLLGGLPWVGRIAGRQVIAEADVRSSPAVPERSNPTGTLVRINGAMPIQFIRRWEGNDLEVAVMRDRSASWTLTARQDKGTWRAVSVYFVIA